MSDEQKFGNVVLQDMQWKAGNYLVNSSQGGGFKDTWVMEA